MTMKKYMMVLLTAALMAVCIGCTGKKEAAVSETETVIETNKETETETRLESDTESEKASEKKDAKKDIKDKERTEQALEEERAELVTEEMQGVEEEEVYIAEPAQDDNYEADEFSYEDYGDADYSGDQDADVCIGDDGDTW